MEMIQVRKEPFTYQDWLVYHSQDNYTFNINNKGIKYVNKIMHRS